MAEDVETRLAAYMHMVCDSGLDILAIKYIMFFFFARWTCAWCLRFPIAYIWEGPTRTLAL